MLPNRKVGRWSDGGLVVLHRWIVRLVVVAIVLVSPGLPAGAREVGGRGGPVGRAEARAAEMVVLRAVWLMSKGRIIKAAELACPEQAVAWLENEPDLWSGTRYLQRHMGSIGRVEAATLGRSEDGIAVGYSMSGRGGGLVANVVEQDGKSVVCGSWARLSDTEPVRRVRDLPFRDASPRDIEIDAQSLTDVTVSPGYDAVEAETLDPTPQRRGSATDSYSRAFRRSLDRSLRVSAVEWRDHSDALAAGAGVLEHYVDHATSAHWVDRGWMITLPGDGATLVQPVDGGRALVVATIVVGRYAITLQVVDRDRSRGLVTACRLLAEVGRRLDEAAGVAVLDTTDCVSTVHRARG